jgi:hypothetical protein
MKDFYTYSINFLRQTPDGLARAFARSRACRGVPGVR